MNLPNPFPGVVANPTVVTTTTTTTHTTPTYKFKKAGTAGTLVAVILDESGSMTSCWDATISGFNEFVAGQKAATNAGAAYLSLIKFDAPHIKTVFVDRPINEVPALDKKNYCPNGGTNLLDAIGYTINQVNNTLANRKREERPGVIIVITTDGEENSSHNFNNSQIKAMVKAAEKSDWSFIFMGANIDSFSVGSAFGMNVNNTVNYSVAKTASTYNSLNATTTRMRSAKMAGSSTDEIYQSVMFTESEKKDMSEDDK